MKGYLILVFSIKDFNLFKESIDKIAEFIKKHGGRYVVQGVKNEAQPLFTIRHNTTESKLILVEGCF